MIKEAGEVEERVVVSELFTEMRSQVRTLSSVEGLRQMVSFPFSIVRTLGANKDGSKKQNNQETLK
jgi:hypothetical protein